MTIQRGDYVRPNNPSLGLPHGSVWRVVCTAGAIKLEPENNAAQNLYAALGGSAVKAAMGSLRGWGIDLRNPHTRKAGPGRQAVHVQGPSLLARTTPRTRPHWHGHLHSAMPSRHRAFVAGE